MAQPGRLRDSLHAILLNAPQTFHIEIVGQIHDGPSALRIIAEAQPTLVVLEYDLLRDTVSEWLEGLPTDFPRPRFLFLASNTHQQQAALAKGANQVLLKGFTVAELFKAIETVLAEREED